MKYFRSEIQNFELVLSAGSFLLNMLLIFEVIIAFSFHDSGMSHCCYSPVGKQTKDEDLRTLRR